MYVIWTLFFGLLAVGTILKKNFNIGWENMTSGQQLTNGILFVAWVMALVVLSVFSIKKVKIRKN
ncbi:hypothetical protein [Bacillus smithii]|uniref:hypothetical protein n=1 Tax=Bacillus smithii TaxID=1479 RepID=UPI003D199BC4